MVEGKVFQEQAKDTGRTPRPTLRSHTRTPIHAMITYKQPDMVQTPAGSMMLFSDSVSPTQLIMWAVFSCAILLVW